MTKTSIDLKRYNYDTHVNEPVGEVSVSTIVHSITHEQFVYLLSEYLNVGMKDQREGYGVGSDFRQEHRTLQGSLYRFCIGIIKGLSEQEYTDARNEIAVRSCKKITQMVEDGEIELGWLI